MAEETQQATGGIRARSIQAENIVDGVQILGADPQQAAALVQLAQSIRRGEITADKIRARNIVTGLQYISDPAHATSDELRKEVEALRSKVDKAIVAQEIPDEADAQDARESLEVAEKELAKPQPNGQRVLRKLDEATTILTKSADLAQSAGKVGAYVLQLAPLAATVWQVAQKFFGL
ncbi:MAG TPA: hypothetical protein VFN23_11225 [Ktedonobacteraceae bacterium]|nr:hypothetical protein [Ktedonobacteraceae bacterium]